MNEKRWFMLKDEQVRGPFSAKELLREIEGINTTKMRFWAKGRPSWQPLPDVLKEIESEGSSHTIPLKAEELWLVFENKTETGPLPFEQLLEHLKSIKNLNNVKVTKHSKKQWEDVYAVPTILEKLGINRRAVPRVPVEGSVNIIDGALKGKRGELTTISQGGFGMKNIEGLSIGETFKGTFSSPGFGHPVHFQAEVVFLNKGNIGAKFLNLSTEALSQIIFYVNQFINKHPDIDFKKIG